MPETRAVEETITSIAKRSWDLFKADAPLYVIAAFLLLVLGSITAGILMGPLLVGFIKIVGQRRRSQPARLGDLFSSLSTTLTSLLVLVLIAVCTSVGSMIFVLPGLLVLLCTAFSFHEIAYKNAGVVGALTGSYRIFIKNFLVVVLVGVLISLLNAVAGITVIGTLLTLPYSVVALTVTYEELTGADKPSA